MNEVITIKDKYNKIIPYRGKGYQYRSLAIKTIIILILCAFLIIYLNNKISFFIPLLSICPLIILLTIYLVKTKNKKQIAFREVLIKFTEDELTIEYPNTPAYDKNYNEIMQDEIYTCSYKNIKNINENTTENRLEIYGHFKIKITNKVDSKYLWEEERYTVRGLYPSNTTEMETLIKALHQHTDKSIDQYGK